MNEGPHVEASGRRAVAVGTNSGIVSTGDHVTIDARTVHLPADAVRRPADVPAPRGTTNLPLPANPNFVDRTEPLARLEAAMDEAGPTAPPVVHGLGGTGKSALALQFAHRHRYRFNPVWWISADSASNIVRGLADLAVRLDPHHLATATSTERAEWALSWLQAHRDWLLVLDDAASPRDLAPVLGMATGRYVITSRRATGWRRLAQPLPLDTLPPDAAVELLTRIIEPDGPGGPDDERDLARLADELGHLPLALEQAAAYIESTAISPAAYLDRLRRYPARMFAAASTGGQEADDQRTVARIWQLSLQAITDQQPLAGDLLRLFAWLAPVPLPRDVLEDLHTHLGEDPWAVDEALALLHSYSMITLTRQTVTVHRLVQAVARLPDPADPHRTVRAIATARERATRLLERALPENPLFDVSGWPRWRELLPHLLALTDRTPAEEEDLHTAGLLVAASAFLQGDGHTGAAVECARHAVDIRTRLQGSDHPDTLAARSFLASAHRAAGDLETATPLHQRNLADHERVHGPDHPDTLVARANLAYLHALRGEPARARDLHRQNLTDMQRLHGPDHPHTINARANLAGCHRDTGDLETAIDLYHQAVADYERVYGPDHSETITVRSNLGYAHQLAGDIDAATALFERVLADRERLYGPDHPLTELARQLLDRTRPPAP
ncbi:tetratricopeptide repeat protein [Streptomyces somaliensis DSM 40738]|uniref:Tetratricopeptide repeat protein n=1 Tax=Streptomyces somaliensis (strain ATCC 33201 / DSM 40738 / JCM 12659 / KCTC 9044 / NCTC 11332 / NRRL B-12077 / IP 733) TaxID=1134445 RepID=A0AA44DA86_STRE0|nr:tetratricopeptide repeat protein [Streptomyces somaliensis]MCQ0024333.1 tetratricopeptide repeat protein [Streptomyces somaliensis DSM 40738]NKY12680.1 tetratricopeptide repeat protein [Streptomyces somaliensis DSM 40738]